MTNEAKNFIPEEILDEANGDPRSAFGIMATRELIASNKGVENIVPEQTQLVPDEFAIIEAPKDVWTLMDDI